ncbi:GxxExxY protein [Luteolibacter ambystomatis]|uniref:GxxExxY protein n=1 Tax=Luteolibacter ambystomatis TaxID=2824561 RepID=A0A975J084_9BACT|nr:GxxExxY protein [Luteolibacter ambystomatis]QUE51622.1 GxxExxY protein [Luteolibacter ambystomatis]
MTQKDPIFQLCDQVRETSFALHSYLRQGHKESVYEIGLHHRLNKKGIPAERQVPLQVLDEDGTLLGNLDIDLLVSGELIVEIKAARALAPEHTAQLLGYLRACRREHGLLINFGAPKLEIRKYALSQEFPEFPQTSSI